ncbi:unnamed protein product [Pieris macdunnoughi]|uniref:Uncharacterized protein n=1 Tax=Pieris macdunnoughi TaxID=345717 RepID=A0A821T5X4_9NEOP|nr:unnamed protein product [Pieris macdunnoughi]
MFGALACLPQHIAKKIKRTGQFEKGKQKRIKVESGWRIVLLGMPLEGELFESFGLAKSIQFAFLHGYVDIFIGVSSPFCFNAGAVGASGLWLAWGGVDPEKKRVGCVVDCCLGDVVEVKVLTLSLDGDL